VTSPRIPATAGNSLTKLGNLSQLTEPDLILHNRGIRSLIVCGVTTEVCVNTTVREANDRGYECVVLSDCVGSYFPEFQRVALEMIKAQGGIFGWVSDSTRALAALGAWAGAQMRLYPASRWLRRARINTVSISAT
jgi:nicotinamidase-related amidase